MSRYFWIATLTLLLGSFNVGAAGPGAVRKLVESSTVITGSVDIDTAGNVSGYGIDHADQLPEAVTSLVASALPNWKFKPIVIDGKPVNARARMSLRLVAKKAGEGSYQLEMRSASFGKERPGESVASVKITPPRYPTEAARNGVSGTVYVLLKIGRNGEVVDAFAEQINLRFIADDLQMRRWRDALARSALDAAKQWIFKPPTAGDAINDDHWVARIPVDYSLGEKLTHKYGEWEVYVPGPRAYAPWVDRAELLASGADAVTEGGVQQLGSVFHLLTPLGAG